MTGFALGPFRGCGAFAPRRVDAVDGAQEKVCRQGDPSLGEEYPEANLREKSATVQRIPTTTQTAIGSQASHEGTHRWGQEARMRPLRDFLTDTEGGTGQAPRETMTRCREAVTSGSMQPPLFPKVQP